MPSSYPRVPLGHLIHIKHGFAFKGELFRPSGEELILTPGNFRIGGGLQRRAEKERFYAGPYRDEFRLNAGDMLVAMTDLTQEAPILGSPLVIPADGVFLHNQRLGRIEVLDEAKLDPGFAYFLFVSDQVRSQLRGSATGATVKHTAPERIYAAEVGLPPLRTQRKIATVLSAYDDLIENNNRRIKILEEMAQRIYREWFVDFRYPGHEGVPLVESELGPIPKGWSTTLLPSVADVRYGTGLRTVDMDDSGSIPVYGAAKVIGSHSTPNVTEPTLIMGCRGTCGGVTITEPCSFVTNNSLMIECSEADRDFLFAHFRCTPPAGFITGAAQPQITLKSLAGLTVTWPPPALRVRYHDAVTLMYDLMRALKSAIARCRACRDMLLPRLISGEIDVSDLDVDVPEAA